MTARFRFHSDTALAHGLRELFTHYNASFALMHEDDQHDAIALDLGVDGLQVYVRSPVDWAVSKIARFTDNDKKDIEALVHLGLTMADEIETRAIETRPTHALAAYVGGQAMVRTNLRDAVARARAAQPKKSS